MKFGMAMPIRSEEGQAVVAPAVLMRGGIDADRKGDQPGEQDGDEGDQHRQPEPVADHLVDWQLILERIAVVAMQQGL
jgi:hypothetical protein